MASPKLHGGFLLPTTAPPFRAKSLGISAGFLMPHVKIPKLSPDVAAALSSVPRDTIDRIAEWFEARDAEMVASCEGLDDDEFVMPTAEARRNAKLVATRMAERSLSTLGHFSFPALEPTASGGVDLHWESPRGELLIGIPSDGTDWVQYYGDTPTGVVTKGRMPHDVVVNVLVAWIGQFL